MSKIRLFIENKEVELTEDIQFNITKQFADYSCPTAIINSWSKTVSIPFTKNNNKIFGLAFSLDKNVDNTSSLFDLNPKLSPNFRLTYGDDFIMSGYVKLNNITKSADKGSYNITLNGSTGDIFNKMKKINMDPLAPNDEYKIQTQNYINIKLDADTVAESFNNEQETLELHTIGEPDYKWTDIMGFAPSNAYKSLFDYSQMLRYRSADDVTFKKIDSYIDSKDFGGRKFEDITGFSASSLLSGDNAQLKPRDIGEFRSWLQLPFIYFNKLFQMFNKKVEDITGYKTILDDKWFNKNNCYWKQLVMMLNTVEDSKDTILSNLAPYFHWIDLGDYESKSVVNNSTTIADLPDTPLKFVLKITTPNKIPDDAIVSLGTSSYMTIQGSETFYRGNIAYGQQEHYSYLRSPELDDIPFPNMTKETDGVYYANVVTPFTFSFIKTQSWDRYSLNIGGGFTTDAGHYFSYYKDGLEYPIVVTDATLYLEEFSGVRSLNSDMIITISDFWNGNYNLFDIILNYCKTLRIGIFVDDVNKTITYKPFKNYFREHTIEDWTDKIDYSKDSNIQYILSDKKWLLFNSGENKTELSTQYKLRTGVNYGETKFDTGNNFNTDEEKLFNNPNPTGIDYTPYILSYKNLIGRDTVNNNPVVNYIMPFETYVCDAGENNKHVSVFGQFYFDDGRYYFYGLGSEQPTEKRAINIPQPILTSDPVAIVEIDKPCYYNRYDSVNISSRIVTLTHYHWLTRVFDGNYVPVQSGYSMNNNEPIYKYNNMVLPEKSIFNIFWDNYLDCIYNTSTKRFTAYVKLNNLEFSKYSPNKLIKINNQLCLLNKIFDYQLGSNDTVKCEFITISDLDKFIEDDFQIEYIAISATTIYTTKSADILLNMSGTGYWNLINNDELIANGIVITPNSGELVGTYEENINIATDSTTQLGEYQAIFETTGYYGDPYKFTLKIIVE